MRRRTALTLIPLAGALLIGACNGASGSSPTATVAPAATPTVAAIAVPTASPTGTPYHVNVPASLQGKYTASITDSSVSSGNWAMEITNNEILATNPKQGAQAFALGVTDITADHVTFFADPECTPGSDTEGQYTYALVNNELRFTALTDACQDRNSLLTAAAWLRQ